MSSVRREPSFFFAVAFALLVPGIASSLASAAGRFPYTAQVATPQAQFRAGPGESFYATSDANEGDLVEVYHEDGDWSAVRPPRGSHSWVSAKLLKLPATLRFQAGVDLASPVPVEVGVAGAPAYIGSDVTGDRDAVAVRLDAGERVYVLSAEPTEGQTWIKIAPPSGEFRWIETKHLKPMATDSAAEQNAEASSAKAPAADASAVDRSAVDVANRSDAINQATLASADEPDATPAVGKSPDAQPAAAATAKPSVKPSATSATGPSHPDRGFWTQLQALELELSMTVAGEPNGWRFDDIRRDAQNLYDSAKSDEEYDAARYLLAKLAQFESVRRERADLDDRISRRQSNKAVAAHTPLTAPATAANPVRRRTSLSGPPPGAIANANATALGGLPPAAVDDSRYDAAGRLVAIPARRAGAPSYAIVDERNNVRQYISPAPNVNLQPYIGRTVGITGVAGPSPDSTRGHVMAKRIDVLDAPVRR